MRLPLSPDPKRVVKTGQIVFADQLLNRKTEELLFFALLPHDTLGEPQRKTYPSLPDLLRELNLPAGSLVSYDGYVWEDCNRLDWYWCNHCRRITPESEDCDPHCQVCQARYGSPHPDDAVSEIRRKIEFSQLLNFPTENLEKELQEAMEEAEMFAAERLESERER